jgi:error-prone DNA polymerase
VDEASSSGRFLRQLDERAADGLYAPLRSCATREHGVEVRPPCVNASRWDCTLEPTGSRYLAVRLGLRIRGLSNADGAKIVAARATASYDSVEDVWRSIGAQRASIESWPTATPSTRSGRSAARAVEGEGAGEARRCLFAAADRAAVAGSVEGIEPAVRCAHSPTGARVIEDYRNLQPLRAHPLSFVRDEAVPTRRALLCRPEHHP